MAITRVDHTTILGTGGGAGPFTSANIDTTTADFIARVNSCGFFNNPFITDSKSNNWGTFKAINDGVGTFQLQGHYDDTPPPSVGTGHNFTIGTVGSSMADCIAAFRGVKSSADPLDQSNSNGNAGSTTIQAGSITPSVDNCLILCGCAVWSADGTSLSIDSGLTISDQVQMSTGNYFGVALAWMQQGAAAAINPTWTLDATPTRMLAIIASFKPDTAATMDVAITEGADVVASTMFANASMAVAATESPDVVAAALGSTFALTIAATESPDAIFAQLGYNVVINIASEEADSVAMVLDNAGSWNACTPRSTAWAECPDPATVWTECPPRSSNWTEG